MKKQLSFGMFAVTIDRDFCHKKDEIFFNPERFKAIHIHFNVFAEKSQMFV